MSTNVSPTESTPHVAHNPSRESGTKGVLEWSMIGIGVTAFLGVIALTFLPKHLTGVIMSGVSMAILWFMFGFGYAPRKTSQNQETS